MPTTLSDSRECAASEFENQRAGRRGKVRGRIECNSVEGRFGKRTAIDGTR